MIPVLTKSTIRALDELAYADIVRAYGSADKIDTRHTLGQGNWKPGDGKPIVAVETPAEAQAIGMCLASRVGTVTDRIAIDAVHPGPCGWCDYPVPELLKACDYATWRSQHVSLEVAIWRDEDGREYVRSTQRGGQYDNPSWMTFWQGATPDTEGASPSDRARWRQIRRDDTARAAGREAA